ncbi:hypothetical protein ES705_37507 [subsurface metagenome]
MNVGENQINSLGYDLINAGKINEAIEILKLNVIEYPFNPNSYDSLGEAYPIIDVKELAIENYKKALQLDPNFKTSKKALKKLRKSSFNF